VDDDGFAPRRLLHVWIAVFGAAGDAEGLQAPQTVQPFEVTTGDVELLERRLNSMFNTVRFVLHRQKRSDSVSIITVTAHNL
jgi:hypothetical protein